MASNFWASTQRQHWLFDKERLVGIRESLDDQDEQLIPQFPLPDLRHFSIYIDQRIYKFSSSSFSFSMGCEYLRACFCG